MSSPLIHIANPRKKLVKISSHALSDYQKCARRFYYSIVRKISPKKYHRAFNRGTVMTKMLEEYYTYKATGGQFDPFYVLGLSQKHVDPSELSDDDKQLISRVFFQYCGHYKNEEWEPVASDLPFSIILYEDDDYLFIYEGTMDLVIKHMLDSDKHIVVDHKTYSKFDSIYPINNQAIGYCHAMKTDTFIYNYVGLTQAKKPSDNFVREIKKYKKQDISSWRETTIKWFKRIADDSDYDKSYNCQGKYGVCGMAPLCECPFDSAREELIRTKYEKNEHASWGKEVPDESE